MPFTPLTQVNNSNSKFTPVGQPAAPKPTESLTSSGPGSLPVIKQLTQLGVGIGTAVGKAGLGIGKTFLQASGKIGEGLDKVTGQPVQKDRYAPVIKQLDNIKENVYEKPFKNELDSTAGKIGTGIGTAIPFVASGGAITDAQKGIAAFTKGSPYLVRLAGQVAPEILGSGATQYAVSGGDAESAKKVGIVSGIISAITHVGSDAFRAIIPQSIKENVTRALGTRGKISLQDAATGGTVDDNVGAFTTMSRLAPDIKVVTKDGITQPFNPLKTDFVELPQVLYQSKNKIYQAYTDLAEKAGDAGVNFTARDFYKVIDKMKEYGDAGYTPAYTNKAEQIVSSLQRFVTKNKVGGEYFADTNPLQIQKLIENINLDVNPLSDKAGAKVAGEASSLIREILDDKINSATGAEYQSLRDAYAQLKTVEPAIVNAYKKALRRAGFASDVIDGIGVVDSLQGMLTKSGAETVRGGLILGVKKAFQYLRDPEVNMQRAFRLINTGEEGATGLGGRFFGSSGDITKVPKELRNTPMGLSIKNVSPEAVAKRLDGEDITLLRGVLQGKDINASMNAEPMLEAMGISKLEPAMQKRFITEVLDLATKKLPVKSLTKLGQKIK